MSKNYVLTPSAARRLKLMFGESGGARRDLTGGAPVAVYDYAAPYAVQYGASAASGGSFMIWLPGDVLIIDGAAVSVTANMTEADSPYPSGWYVLTAPTYPTGGNVYLIISPGSGSSGTSARFSDSASSSGSDTSIKIAEIDVESSTGAVRVKQLVDSAIIIGADKVNKPFNYSNGTVAADSAYVDGELKTVSAALTIPQQGKATAYLVCTGTQSSSSSGGGYVWSVALSTTPAPAPSGSSTDKVMNVKLYDFSAGAIVKDYRGANLPVCSGGASGTVQFVGDVKYDTVYHVIQKRVDTLDLSKGTITQGQYETITGGHAVPLSGG